jgi:hypothetical protein
MTTRFSLCAVQDDAIRSSRRRLWRQNAALMRLTAKDEFVSAAERANAALDFSHQPESGATLMLPRAPAHWTVSADIGQRLVESGWS